jgi:hypothetical protein
METKESLTLHRFQTARLVSPLMLLEVRDTEREGLCRTWDQYLEQVWGDTLKEIMRLRPERTLFFVGSKDKEPVILPTLVFSDTLTESKWVTTLSRMVTL